MLIYKIQHQVIWHPTTCSVFLPSWWMILFVNRISCCKVMALYSCCSKIKVHKVQRTEVKKIVVCHLWFIWNLESATPSISPWQFQSKGYDFKNFENA